jgi:phenylalanyl-tRNA synthetase beta chain
MAARGMVETVTWSFLSAEAAERFGGGAEALRLANPIASDLGVMRPSLLPNLIAAAARNAHRGLRDAALFEIGPQFVGDRPEDQQTVLCGLRSSRAAARHWSQPARPVDAFDAKADVLAAVAAAGGPADSLQVSSDAPAWYHPGRSGSLRLGQKVVGHFGELHPGVLAAMDLKATTVGFELFIAALPVPKTKPTRAKSPLKPSPFQPIERDFAFVVDSDVAADRLLRAVRGVDKGLIVDAAVFDLYEGPHVGPGHKSLAIQVTLQPAERTLTDAEIEAVGARIVDAVTKATGGRLRG